MIKTKYIKYLIVYLTMSVPCIIFSQNKVDEKVKEISVKANQLLQQSNFLNIEDSAKNIHIRVEKRIRELSNKANTLIQQTHFSLAQDSIEEALNLIPNITQLKLKSQIQHQAAISYSLNDDIKKAIQYYLKANDTYKRQADSMGMYRVNIGLSSLFYDMEAYEKSMEYYNNATNLFPIKTKIDSVFELEQLHSAKCFIALNKFDTSAIIYKRLLIKYKDNSDKKSELNIVNKLTHIYEKQGRYLDAIPYYEDLFMYYNITNQQQKSVEVLNNIGYNFVLSKQYNRAKNSFINAEKRMKVDSFNVDFKASLYANLGICFQNMNNYQEAIPYLLKSLELRKQSGNTIENAKANQMVALTYYRFGDLYNAYQYALEGLKTAKTTNSPYLISNCYKTCSTIAQAMEDHEKAMEYYSRYLLIQDSIFRTEREKRRLLNEKILALEKNEKELKLKIAEENVKDILLEQLQLKAKQREQENEILKQQTELQALEQERIQQALLLVKQQNEALAKQREIENLEKERQLQENKLKLKEAQEKEQAKAYALLQAEKEKQNIELKNKELVLEQQAERAQKFKWIMGLAIIIIIMAILFVMHTRRKNRLLSKQKAEIEEINEELSAKNEEINRQAEYLKETNDALSQKNEEIKSQRDDLQLKNEKIEEQAKQIISSIQYAKRIQEAVLPDDINLQELLPEHFIFFRPRDIVSGDFYWIKQIHNSVYATVADCTGHGVPGAFMSMLGTAFLNEITGQSELLSPSQILNELREKVKKSLKQVGKTGEAKDGMDMGMLKIDMDTQELTFSGAHNGLIHIRTNSETNEPELNYIKADRMPIGIYRKERGFTDHQLELQPGDMLYMYSDGYIDQFGGEDNSKFMSKKFKALVLKISQKPLTEQYQILEANILEWMGDTEQLDDMCILGIRIPENYGEAELF